PNGLNIIPWHRGGGKAIMARGSWKRVFPPSGFGGKGRFAHFRLNADGDAAVKPRVIRRSVRGKTSKRYGRPCSIVRSTGSSATMPAVRPNRNGRRTIRRISGSRKRDLAAPSTCSQEC